MKINRIIMNVILSTIVGISISLMMKALTAHSDIQSSAVFVAEMSKNIMPGQRITAESLLKDVEQVDESSIKLISADQALATMKADMPELAYMADNPFLDIITFETKGLKLETIEGFKQDLLEIKGIENVYYDRTLMETLPDSLGRVRWGILIMGFLFLLGALVILSLRIKRDLRAYSQDIRILSIAGSDEDKIINARVAWSTKWGSISAAIAAVFMLINIIFINNTLLDGLEITFLQSIISIVAMLVLVIGSHALVTHQGLKSYFANLNLSITQ